MKNRFKYISIILLLVPGFSLAQTKTADTKCLECHAKLNAKKFTHISSGSCNDCHIPNGKMHPSKEEEEGFTMADKMPQLCNKCHTPVETGSTHKPVKKGNCTGCHEMHSSNNKMLLSSQPPELCFFCHGELQTRVDSSKSSHSILKQGVSCLFCHFPHRSELPKLIVSSEKELCLKCHDKVLTKDSVKIRNIKKELDNSRYVHTAITKNGCSGCHDPHSTSEKSLLKSRFENTTYIIAKGTNAGAALCFTCHDPALLDTKKTSTATAFRNGESNLHNKHVAKYKGRNCINCHNVHASQNEFLMADRVKFGGWVMPLKFTKFENGGRCITACHAPKSYSRKME